MKTTFVVLALFAAALSAQGQTSTADDATNSGAKVGTGADVGINAPENVGPRTGPTNPAGGAITTPPPEISPTPPSAPNAGTGAATDGTGTGR